MRDHIKFRRSDRETVTMAFVFSFQSSQRAITVIPAMRIATMAAKLRPRCVASCNVIATIESAMYIAWSTELGVEKAIWPCIV